MDIKTLDEKCPLLVSRYREAIPLSNQAIGNRKVLEDPTVSYGQGNSWVLKKSVNIQTSLEILHTLHNVWGDDVLDIYPERLIENGGKEDAKTEKEKRSAYVLLPLDKAPTGLKVPPMQPRNLSQAAGKPEKSGDGVWGSDPEQGGLGVDKVTVCMLDFD